MRKIYAAILIMFVFSGYLWGAAGTTSVLDIGPGVKTQALGNAFIAGTDDSSAVFYNPASLYTLDRIEIQGGVIPLFLDTFYNYFTAGIPTMDFGVFAFNFAMINTDKIGFRDSYGNLLSEESQRLMEFSAGWGREFFDENLLFGLNIKIDNHSTGTFNDTGFGFDLGFLYRGWKNGQNSLDAGIIIKNALEPQFKLSAESDILPRQYGAGAVYKRVFSEDAGASLYADAVFSPATDFEFRAGLDVNIFRMISLRAGYNSYNITSFGAGIDIMGTGIIDYALVFSEIDTQNRFSLKFRFGDSIIKMRERKEEIELKKIERKARTLAAKELAALREKIDELAGEAQKEEYFKAFHYSKAIEAYFEGDLNRALLEFETVGREDEDYMSTRYYISMIKGLLKDVNEGQYSDEILVLYRAGVKKYLAEDYEGAKAEWEKILKIDPYNKLAIENLKEVRSLIRDIEKIGE